jgi:hypothetical protein
MSMVEPKEVALRSGEFVSDRPTRLHAHTHRGPEEQMEEIYSDRNDEWKWFNFFLAEDVLQNRGGMLGSMNVATHRLALTGDLPKGKDQRCAACHSCHQQWTIDNHHEFRPVCSVCHDHVNCLSSRERTANAVRVWPAKTGIGIA